MAKRILGKSPKSIISAVLGIEILILVLSLVVSFVSKDTKTISSTAFDKGGLDASGEYIKSDTSIVTKNMFECQGLCVELDFEADLEYEVFYYRSSGSYLGSSGRISTGYEKDSSFDNAKYARIVIYPTLEKDKISFFEVYSIANQITVTVLKDQSFEPYTTAIFPDVDSYLDDATEFYTSYAIYGGDGPFVYSGDKLTAYENKHISKIGIPVKVIKYIDRDCKFKVKVVSGNGTSAFKVVKSYDLVIKKGTFNNLEKVTEEEACLDSYPVDGEYGTYQNYLEEWYKVDQWVYFDVDIDVGKGQTLAFTDSSDTICAAYLREPTDYSFYNRALVSPGLTNNLSIFFDVWVEE